MSDSVRAGRSGAITRLTVEVAERVPDAMKWQRGWEARVQTYDQKVRLTHGVVGHYSTVPPHSDYCYLLVWALVNFLIVFKTSQYFSALYHFVPLHSPVLDSAESQFSQFSLCLTVTFHVLEIKNLSMF